jgi:hypothetical protein
MADGFKIEMDDERAQQLKAAAKARGVEPAEFARQLLERALEDDADRTNIERRVTAFEETGEAIDHSEIVDLLRRRAAS